VVCVVARSFPGSKAPADGLLGLQHYVAEVAIPDLGFLVRLRLPGNNVHDDRGPHTRGLSLHPRGEPGSVRQRGAGFHRLLSQQLSTGAEDPLRNAGARDLAALRQGLSEDRYRYLIGQLPAEYAGLGRAVG
jgi:hypothetical protein